MPSSSPRRAIMMEVDTIMTNVYYIGRARIVRRRMLTAQRLIAYPSEARALIIHTTVVAGSPYDPS